MADGARLRQLFVADGIGPFVGRFGSLFSDEVTAQVAPIRMKAAPELSRRRLSQLDCTGKCTQNGQKPHTTTGQIITIV